MSDLNQKLAVMVKEADLRKRGVMDSCPVTEEWLKHRYEIESSGESFGGSAGIHVKNSKKQLNYLFRLRES